MTGKSFFNLVAIVIASLHIARLSSCNDVNESKILCVSASENATECTTQFMPRYNCTVCRPLSHYVLNGSNYLTSNVKMIFAVEEHCLHALPNDHSENIVNLTGVSNFTMKGLGNVTNDQSEEGSVQPSSVITCSCSQNKSAILFYKSQTIHIENLAMEDCGTTFVPIRTINYVLVSALTFIASSDIKLVQLRMNRNMGYGLDAAHIFGNFTIADSSFLRSVAYKEPMNMNSALICGNARIRYTYFEPWQNSNARTNLLIERSSFLYAAQNNKSLIKHLPNGGGLSLYVRIPNVTILISHIKAKYNVGGNMEIRIYDFTPSVSVTINNSIIANGSATYGGGLNIWIEIVQDLHANVSTIDVCTFCNTLTILKTNFTNNVAIKRGGSVHISYKERSVTDHIKRYVYFKGCQFSRNSIVHDQFGVGAAVYIFKHEMPEITSHTVLLFSFHFINCTFKHNQLTNKKGIKEGGIVGFIMTNGIIIEDSNFTSNEGTAIFLQNSIVQFRGTLSSKVIQPCVVVH